MLAIDWPGTEAEGWIDYIPMRWFAQLGRTAQEKHLVRGPKDKAVWAHCSINVHAKQAILHYGGDHAAVNEANELYIGLLKIIFVDRERDDVSDVLWREVDEKQFQRSCVFQQFDEDYAASEGTRSLVQHFRAERRPGLAAKKKAQVLRAQEFLTCEACELDLRTVYGSREQKLANACYEVHHRIKLSAGHTQTKLGKLAILCANCHRAIHRTDPMLSVEKFRQLYIRPNRGKR